MSVVARVVLGLLGHMTWATLGSTQIILPQTRARLTGDYARYESPLQCLFAMEREERFVRRSPVVHDTLSVHDALVADTLPTAATVAGRRCVAHLDAQRLHVSRIPALARAWIIVGRDSMARAVLRTARARMPGGDSSNRQWMRSTIFGTYTAARPRRADVLTSVFNEIMLPDSLPMSEMLVYRMDIMARWWAEGMFDSTAGYARAALREYSRASLAEQKFEKGAQTVFFPSVLETALLRGGFAAGRAVLTEMDTARKSALGEYIASFGSFAEVYGLQWVFTDSAIRGGVQVAAPTLAGDHWIRRADTAARPRKGRVTLLVDPASFLSNPGAGGSGEVGFVAVLKRLDRKYGARGLDIVWAMQTRGWFRDSKVLTEQEEAEALAKYFFDYLKAPGVMVIEHSKFSVRADGMRTPLPTINRIQYGLLQRRTSGLLHGISGLVDQEGNFVWSFVGIRSRLRDQEAILSAKIEQLLKRS